MRTLLASVAAVAGLTAGAAPWTLDDMPPTNTVYTSQEVDAAVAAATAYAAAGLSNKVDSTDARLSDAREPLPHVHDVRTDFVNLPWEGAILSVGEKESIVAATFPEGAILKGNGKGDAITAANAGLDYVAPEDPRLAAVATIGPAATNYTDAAAASVRSYASAVSNKLDTALEGKADASHTHTASEIENLATVARTGYYSDLIGSPAIPSTPSDIGAASAHHGHSISDVSGLESALNGKAERAMGAVDGNFAGLDAFGNPTDSGKNAADFAAANHTHDIGNLETSAARGTMFAADNKGGIVPAVAGTDYVVPANLVAVSNALDAAIRAAEPGNYATVSNRAMTALQSYTETDPSVPAWAKAANKPAYTAAEVGALAVEADPVFAAWVATNVPSGGGGVDMGAVTNLVTDLLAEAPDATALAALKAIIADLWQRLDAIEHADGSDALTAAQTEALVNDRVSSWESMIQTWSETHGALPIQSTNVTQIALRSSSSTTGLAIELSPLCATEYSGSVSIGIASVSGVGLNPCWLVLKSGVTSVSFPSGAKVKGSFSSGNDNFYRVSRVSGGLIVEKVYP